RTADNPLDVFLLGDTPLPIKIDRITGWAEAQPHPIGVMAARGVVPDCRTDTKGFWDLVAAMLPDLYGTPDAARMALTRSREQTSMDNIFIDIRSRERDRTNGQGVDFPAGRSTGAADLSREQTSIGKSQRQAWQPLK